MLDKRDQDGNFKSQFEKFLLVVIVSFALLFLINILVTTCSSKVRAETRIEQSNFSVPIEPWESDEWVDPKGQSVLPEIKDSNTFPNESQMRLIGRLAFGLEKWKRAQGGWWYCGEWIEAGDPKITDLALSIAYRVVESAADVSENPEIVEDAFTLNVWGMVGTIANESRFDVCALGLYPRKWAYNEGILTPRKACISHTKDEVLTVVHNDEAEKYFKRSGFDIGFCQILTRFYREIPPKEIMTINKGIALCAREMKIRAMSHKTDRPWLYWRGSATPWYDAKIKRWAYKLGARKDEI